MTELFNKTSGQGGTFDSLRKRTGLLRLVTACLFLPLVLSACARHYRVEGLVLDVSRQQRTMIVSHRAIPGYMGAMAMPFQVQQPRECTRIAARRFSRVSTGRKGPLFPCREGPPEPAQ